MQNIYILTVMIGVLIMGGCAFAETDEGGFYIPFTELSGRHWYVSNGWTNGDYQSCEWRADAITIADNHLEMTLSDHGGDKRAYGCAEFHTSDALSYGLYEARMQTAAGSGLNTAFFTYVGPPNGVPHHDEIDFEFLGRDSHTVAINYWTDGKSQLAKSIQLGFDASKDYHDYAFEWSDKKISWYIDKKLVYETGKDAVLPSHAGRLYFSLWSGAKAEDSWLGPFQYTSPLKAKVMWVAYTPPDKSCLFPQSLKCK